MYNYELCMVRFRIYLAFKCVIRFTILIERYEVKVFENFLT